MPHAREQASCPRTRRRPKSAPLAWHDGGMQGDPVFVDMMSERGPALLEYTMADKKAAGRVADPDFARAYGRMPK